MSSCPKVGRFFYQRGFSEYGVWRPDILGEIDVDSVPVGSVVPVQNDRVVVLKQVLYHVQWNRRSPFWDRVDRSDRLARRGLEFVLHLHKCEAETFVALGWTVASAWSPAQPNLWPSMERR